MKALITLRDTNDPLKDMGAITVTDNEITELPWYIEDSIRIIGFATPNDMEGDSDVYAIGEWMDKIEGLTPIFSTSNGMYQLPHIIVAGVEYTTN